MSSRKIRKAGKTRSRSKGTAFGSAELGTEPGSQECLCGHRKGSKEAAPGSAVPATIIHG